MKQRRIQLERIHADAASKVISLVSGFPPEDRAKILKAVEMAVEVMETAKRAEGNAVLEPLKRYAGRLAAAGISSRSVYDLLGQAAGFEVSRRQPYHSLPASVRYVG